MACWWKMHHVEAGAVCCRATASCIPGRPYKESSSLSNCSIAQAAMATLTPGRIMHSSGLWTLYRETAGRWRVLQRMYPGWQTPGTVRVILRPQAEMDEL